MPIIQRSVQSCVQGRRMSSLTAFRRTLLQQLKHSGSDSLTPSLTASLHMSSSLTESGRSSGTSKVGTNPESFDITIVGGGIIGAAVGMQLAEQHPTLRIALVEKEDRLDHNMIDFQGLRRPNFKSGWTSCKTREMQSSFPNTKQLHHH